MNVKNKKPIPSREELLTRCKDLERQINELTTELALRTSPVMTPQLRAFFEQSRDGIVVIDMQRRILDANQAFCSMVGYSLEELKSIDGIANITVEKWRQWELEEIGEIRLKKNGYSGLYEKEYIHKNGTIVPVEVQSYVGLNSQGIPDYLWAIVRDITDRKQSDLALKEREEKLRSYFDNAPHGVFIANKKGEYVQVNPAACKMTGYSEEELVGMNLRNTIPDGQLNESVKHFQRVIEQGSADAELQYRRKNGEIRWWHIAAVRLSDNRFLGFTTDTTDRHKAEEKYATLFKEILNGFALHEIICDDDGKPVDYRFLTVNPAFERMTGLKASEIIGKTVLEVLPKTEPFWIETYGKVALTGESVKFENYSRELDEYFEVTAYRTAPAQFATIFEDTTEREHALKALRISEERYQSFIDTHIDLIYIKDENLRYLVVNETILGKMNKSRDQVIGKTDHELIDEEFAKMAESSDREALRLNKPITRIERIRGRVFESLKFPLKLDGDTIGVGSIIRDISDKVRTAETIERLNERFELAATAGKLGVWDLDIMGNRLEWDDRMLELYGISREEFGGKYEDWSRYVLPEDAEITERKVQAAIQEGKRLDFEFRITRKDGSIRFIKADGVVLLDESHKPYRMTGINYDITDRKEMEKALLERENYLNRIIQTTVDGFWIANRKGDLQEVNDAYCAMIGYRRDELLNMNIADLAAFEDQQAIEAQIRNTFQVGSEIFNTVHRKKNGELLPVEISVSYLDEHGGQVVCFCRDLSERIKAEEALRSSETLARTVIENSPIGISVRSTTGQLLLHNQAWLDVWEMTQERLQQDLKAREKLHLDDRDEYLSVHQREVQRVYREGGTYYIPEVETTGKRSLSGQKRFLSQHFSGIKNNKGEVERVVILTSDITERKLAEEELRRSEERFRSYVENASDIVFAFNPEGVFTYISPNWLHFIGEPAENAIGKTFESYVFPEDMSKCYQYFENILTTRTEITNFSFRILHRDGTYRWLVASGACVKDKNGIVTSIVGIARDVTEAKKAEAERERLIAAIEQADEMVVITDQKGTIEYINPAFEKVTGYTRDEALGKNLSILKSGEQGDDFYDRMWKDISGGEAWKGRFVNRRKDGSLYSEEASISPIRDSGGNITNFVSVKRDITRELEMERQFMQSQKMESVGRLAGGIAHDFNNMLLVILGHAELILDDDDLNLDLIESIREIQHAAQHSADLTRQLLAFARKQTASPKVLDINHTVESMLKMLHRLIGESIKLEWFPGQKVSPIRIDPAQLDQILANLSVNARDAIDGHGKILIETDNATLDEAYCKQASGCIPGDYVKLSFSDNGRGMDKYTRQQIFEPFFTTKNVGEGTGLGLATVYGIIMQNHGYINVYSEPGKGTTFHIYLPALQEFHVQPQSQLRVLPPLGNAERILMVDDEPAILRMGRTMLERLGYQVITAQSPNEAINIAKQYDEEIDLLVTDVVMPEMNGSDLAKLLTQRYPKMRHMFISGYTANVITRQGIIKNDVNFLQKPFSFLSLATCVRKALEKTE